MVVTKGVSDIDYDPQTASELYLWAVDELLKGISIYGPMDEIVLLMGNDFFDIDNLQGTTTRGTPQAESDQVHNTYLMGEALVFEAIERVAAVAPVKVKMIPGNHDELLSFTLGRVINARFWNDQRVEVDATPDPYKFWKYGKNLIGYEHGSNIPPIRLAGLMANSVPQWWADTDGGFREWHLGDQHRKISSKPTTAEEQGVSVDYLPGITSPNKWHRQKAFNFQKRGATAFVYSYERGPATRIYVNLNNKTGRPLGEGNVGSD